MKKIFTLLALLCIGFARNANAQAFDYQIYSDSMLGCQNSVYLYIWCGTNPELGGSVEINWGDGTTDNVPFDIPANSTTNVSATHTFAVPGTYLADVQVYSGTNSAFIDAGEQLSMIGYAQNSCGYFSAYVNQNAPYVYYPEVPMDCVGANGETTTITPSYGYGYYVGLDPSNAPYTVSVSNDWLTANGYIQATADQTITSFNTSGMADNMQMTFQITCNVPAQNPDFDVYYVWPSNFVAPLQTGNLMAYVCNNACSDTSDVTLSVNFPAGFIPVTTDLTNPVVTGNNLSFDVLGLSACTSIVIPFTFPGTVQSGTEICFDMTAINPNDTEPSNNSDEGCGVVWNSYDPNGKEVDHSQNIDASEVETLEYMIHFQNDGNSNAVNVSVIDTISANLDLSTFKLIGSKHGVAVNIDPVTRIATFTFSGCMLTPSTQDLNASQGYIVYSIDEVAGLQVGDEIKNTAYIYFDYNSPVVTNTTLNVNTQLGIANQTTALMALYPNPAQTSFTIIGGKASSVSVIDMTGKVVLTKELSNSNTVGIEHLSNGVYTVLMTTENGISQQRLVVQK